MSWHVMSKSRRMHWLLEQIMPQVSRVRASLDHWEMTRLWSQTGLGFTRVMPLIAHQRQWEWIYVTFFLRDNVAINCFVRYQQLVKEKRALAKSCSSWKGKILGNPTQIPAGCRQMSMKSISREIQNHAWFKPTSRAQGVVLCPQSQGPWRQ